MMADTDRVGLVNQTALVVLAAIGHGYPSSAYARNEPLYA